MQTYPVAMRCSWILICRKQQAWKRPGSGPDHSQELPGSHFGIHNGLDRICACRLPGKRLSLFAEKAAVRRTADMPGRNPGEIIWKCSNDYGANPGPYVRACDKKHSLCWRDIASVDIFLHLGKERKAIECVGKLADYEVRLSDSGFLRLQKSYLANMEHIVKIRNYIATLRDGTELKVSERQYTKVKQQFLMWKGRILWTPPLRFSWMAF